MRRSFKWLAWESFDQAFSKSKKYIRTLIAADGWCPTFGGSIDNSLTNFHDGNRIGSVFDRWDIECAYCGGKELPGQALKESSDG